ncbi:caspase family protein [Actinosynnema sp. NPDC047251]|uniref:Peptidase C14 caspase domain-containing protein n=1 Tax=Saccharothrix espanaensis (strain ATCC 51144 / DSM 44229 / JCM 9112 / NBRC 15066 / NRRL 15764) TaxID=1179773 RepID=K0KBF7_SACES|nr:caspase family protein [Saccharothrix espanaensis]CCH34134.1 hypothetical protein BN6_68970 [Saccharothrix espanaensis DSM 44229]
MRTALLIATDTYTDPTFGALRAPHRDAAELAEVLADPSIGAFATEVLLNEPVQHVRERLDGLFAEAAADDLVLLYLSGHGVKDRTGRLHFATTDTRDDRLPSTGLAAAFVRELVDDSRAGRVVLWLDCCFGGAFPVDLALKGDDVDVVDQLSHGRGRSVMTASTAIQFAYEPSGEVRGETRPSLFTQAIIEGLRGGAADLDGDGEITTRELYAYVYDHVRRTTPNQTPTSNDSVAGAIAVARAANRPGDGVRLTTEPALGEPAFVRDLLVWQGRVWRVGSWEEVGRIDAHGPHAFNRSGTLLAAGEEDSGVGVWNTAGPPETWKLEVGLHGRVLPWGARLSFSHEDAYLALARDGAPEVWNRADWTHAEIRWEAVGESVVFHPTEPLAVVGSSPPRLFPCGPEGWGEPEYLRGWLEFERFSSDGRLAAFHRQDDVVLLDTGDWEEVGRFPHDAGHTRRCAFSPDDRRLATSSTLGVRLVDLATGEAVRLADSGFGCVPAFSPDGRFLAVGLNDGLRVWDVRHNRLAPAG